MKRLFKILATGLVAAAASAASALTYNPSDLLLVFHQSGSSDVIFNIGPAANYANLPANTVVPVSYDKTTVSNNFGSLSGFNYAVVGANDSSAHLWLSSADLAGTPSDLTLNTYATLLGKIDNVGTGAKLATGGDASPYVIAPTEFSSYSYIVSPDDQANVSSMGGDAPFTVSTNAPGRLALYQLVPTTTSPTPVAIKLGTFNLAADGTLTFTAGSVTPVITALSGLGITTRGGSATLSATAEGATGYQWYRNGVAIAGATNTTLTVSDVQPGDVGNYTVVASNSNYLTSATSNTRNLRVSPAYLPTDALLVFHDGSNPDVVFNLGSISNFINQTANSTKPLGYNQVVVLANFGSLTGVRVSLMAAADALNTVWLSDANISSIPTDLTLNTYATLFGKIDNVGTVAAGVVGSLDYNNPFIISPADPNSYSSIVSPGDLDNVDSFGGDAPFNVGLPISAGSPVSLPLYALHPTVGTPAVATFLGSFNLPAGGSNLTFTAACPDITVSGLTNAVKGVAYTNYVSGAGSAASYTNYSITAGSLPTGLSLNPATGKVSGKPTAYGVYTFTITATDTNGCSGGQSQTMIAGDTAVPTVKIGSPKNGGVVTNYPLTVTGTAKDATWVTAVHYWLDAPTSSPATGIASGTNDWSITLSNAAAGPHTVIVRSEDLSGNLSKPASVLLHYGTNSFADLGGEYNGLFNTNNGLTGDFRHVDSGLFQVKVKVKAGKLPTFTGSLSVDGNKLGFAGTFEMTGVGTVNKTKSNPDGIIDRSAYGKSNLTLTVQLPFDGSGTISGTVSNIVGAWVSTMAGYLAAGPEDTNYTGNYTMVIPGSPENSATEPGGSGYGVVVITNGVIKVAGSKLGDGQSFAQKVSISEGGLWPLYSAANKDALKEYQSAIMGWVTVSNKATAGLSGTLTWDKHADLSVAYPAGFTSAVELAASPYFPGDPGATMILPYTVGASNGLLTVEDGGLLSALTNSVTLSTSTGKNKITVTTTKTEKMSLSVTPKTGLLTFSVVDTNSLVKYSGNGVVLTNTATGHGFFMVPKTGTNSGAFTLEGN